MAPGLVFLGSEAAGEFAGVAVDGNDFFRFDQCGGAQQIGVIGVVGKGNGSVSAITKSGRWIQGPAGHDGGAGLSHVTDFFAAEKLWLGNQGVSLGDFFVCELGLAQGYTRLAAGFRHFCDSCAVDVGSLMGIEDGGDFLRFA